MVEIYLSKQPEIAIREFLVFVQKNYWYTIARKITGYENVLLKLNENHSN